MVLRQLTIELLAWQCRLFAVQRANLRFEQSSTMSFSFASVLLHSLSASIMAYGYNSLKILPIDSLISTQYGGHFQFLTIQGYVLDPKLEIPLELHSNL